MKHDVSRLRLRESCFDAAMRARTVGADESVAAIDDHLRRVHPLFTQRSAVRQLPRSRHSRAVWIRPAEAVPIVDMKREWIHMSARPRGFGGELSENVVRGWAARTAF